MQIPDGAELQSGLQGPPAMLRHEGRTTGERETGDASDRRGVQEWLQAAEVMLGSCNTSLLAALQTGLDFTIGRLEHIRGVIP